MPGPTQWAMNLSARYATDMPPPGRGSFGQNQARRHLLQGDCLLEPRREGLVRAAQGRGGPLAPRRGYELWPVWPERESVLSGTLGSLSLTR